jgi:membrane-associated phospholipid phosphatase
MTAQREPFWGLPSRDVFRLTLLLALAVTFWFEFVYAGANYLTSLRDLRVRIHLDVELDLALVPALVLVYLSIFPLFWISPFILRRRPEVFGLGITLLVVISCAGLGFLLCPAEAAFASPGALGVWEAPFDCARAMALRYNMVPSLHVALSIACIAAYASRAGKLGQGLLWTWAAAIAVSTLLTHQHHLVDVITGGALGLAGKCWVFDRLAKRGRLAPLGERAPASLSRGPRPSD